MARLALERFGRFRSAAKYPLVVVTGLTVVASVGLADGSAVAAAKTLSASANDTRSCHAGPATGRRSVDTITVTAPSTGVVRARLDPLSARTAMADWDLAVFDQTGRVVAASAGPRSLELADGQVRAGDRLTVQGCRYAGSARTVSLTVEFHPAPSTPPAAASVQVVEVATPTEKDRVTLAGLGLQLAEHETASSQSAMVRNRSDAEKLNRAGLTFTVKVPDVAAVAKATRTANTRYARTVKKSDLPSGRTTYRRLADYEYEMKELARLHPHLVRLVVLPHRTVEGRLMLALEITNGPAETADGKPVFLNTGANHPPEWIASEHVMEWAYDLVNRYPRDARVRRLLNRSRAVLVPQVNPDGFAVTREASPTELVDGYPAGVPYYEFTRKNCSTADVPAELRSGICLQNPALQDIGVDLNRNWGGLWGGPGAGTTWNDQYFRGPAPFSEPETRNIRQLVSSHQVVTAINNHSAANLILRQPDLASGEVSPDEPVAAALGARLSKHNGYPSLRGWQLYDTSGTAESWEYKVAGTLAYSMEIGEWISFASLHPPFPRVVEEYLGRGNVLAPGKGGNRAVYDTMLAAASEPKHHATITGRAPAGWMLQVDKRISTPTAPVIQSDGSVTEPLRYADHLSSTLRARGGRFTWPVNPSTRPQLAGRTGRKPVAPPQPTLTLPNPSGESPVDPGDPQLKKHESVPFTIDGLPRYDNGYAKVRIEWTDPDSDYDLFVYDPNGTMVGMSVEGKPGPWEEAVVVDPVPGTYRAVVQKVAGHENVEGDDWSGGKVTFESPRPGATGVTEAWLLTCRRPDGAVARTQKVTVDRGRTAEVGDICRVPASVSSPSKASD